jgi:hypothetical protein
MLVTIFLVLPLAASAQAEVRLTSLEVDLWPEYDRPGVLVIYRITLSPAVSLPADLTLRIPAESGEPNAVAARDAEGGLYNVNFKREVTDGWSRIRFTATMPEIQVEYYDPQLDIQGNNRFFEYHWPGDYAIDTLLIEVQQPLGAEEMRTTPSLGNGVTREDGLIYYSYQVGSIGADQSFDVSLEYQKSSSALTAEGLQVKPSVPVSNITSRQRRLDIVIPWVLGGLGVVLILGGGLWYWRTGTAAAAPKPPRGRRKPVIPQEESATAVEGHVYCHHCGKRAMPNDRFCRTCGTRLRPE